MADTTTLLQALQAGLERPTDTGYGIGAQIVASGIPALNNPYASTGSNMAHAIGGSLLGGLLAGYARQSSAETNAELMPLMNQMLLAKTPEDRMAIANTSSNPGRLSPLVQALAMEDYSSNRKVQDNINSKLVDFQYNPQIKAAEQKALIPLENQQKIDQGIGDLAMKQGYVVDGGKMVPLSDVGLKSDMELQAQQAADTTTSRLKAEADFMGYNPQRADAEDKLRTEITTKVPSVAQWMTMKKTLPILENYATPDTRSSDVAFVYNYVKALDDNAVRGEELNLIASSNPLVQKYFNEIDSAFTGKSALTPQLKQQMLAELKSNAPVAYEQAVKDANPFLKIAQDRGLNAQNILPFELESNSNNTATQLYDPQNLQAQGYTYDQRRGGWVRQ